MGENRFETRLKGDHNTYKELFLRSRKNPILSAKDWPYPVNSVFNPAATMFQGKVLLLARVEDRRGFSHLTKAISNDGVSNWQIDKVPTLEPDPENYPEERWGIEDPRITWLVELGKWAITYTAYSRGGPLVAMALTDDFIHFERHGPIMPPEDKDAALFPRRINGKWALIHRPITANYVPGTHIWLSSSDNFNHWGDRQVLMHARRGGWWDGGKIGLAAPPIETAAGWILLYHGVRQTASGSIYRLGLALLDLDNPIKVLHRSDEWVFGPTEWYEREGDVDDVVFPSGWVLDNNTGLLKMYYGGADSCIAVATASVGDLLEYIKRCPEPLDASLY
ncbi:Beta-1,4-mannooligosaccharide phosphorylase [Sporomusa silvacetica DSM 10669]|uniref:Beta-1,4-mannooligosaccharide phosphorylase n=1 Tax=Sporomusa silvacetica DSM 10669 TaxID=1123289 RepID=A0ABZ3IHX8_9FIRM|nr:glycosidase [Sporomusa silvacetica]OZC16751.1 beta-1,4-mannooligosaccharide phosphorylase [Sporomusa silvacetica DSM 10669]